MNPPSHGARGILVSTVCLGAALAVKRGGSTELTRIQSDQPVTPELEAAIRRAHSVMVEVFRKASPLELDCSIALYQAHLKAAGVLITTGRDN